MQQRTQCTIQEIIEDLRMTSTTRFPVKAKSLTLLELCQTINDLRHTSSRSTAQILTRRLYLHPLTISTNAKQHTSKVIPNNLVDIERFNRTSITKKLTPRKHKTNHGLAVLSSSVPLITRTNSKLNSSITTDNDEASTITIASNPVSLPSINRGATSSLTKRTMSTRSSYISNQQKPKVNHPNRWEKVDVWQNLARTLQRPTPKDPPTTPLDISSDIYLNYIHEQEQQQRNYSSIQEIKIYKRNPVSKPIVDENNDNEED